MQRVFSPTGKPTASVTAVIPYPAFQVWQLIAAFDDWSWWPALDQFSMPNPDVGGTRSFRSIGTASVYEELLAERNRKNYTILYEFVGVRGLSAANQNTSPVKSIVTRMTLQEAFTPDEKEITNITWESWTTLQKSADNPQTLAAVTTLQQATYQDGITQLISYLWRSSLLILATKRVNQLFVVVERALALGNKWIYDDYASPPGRVRPLPRMVMGLPFEQKLTAKRLGERFTRVIDFLYTGLILKSQGKVDMSVMDNNILAYKMLTDRAQDIDESKITNHVLAFWQNDEEFCRQLLQGCEPMTINLVTDPTKVPEALQLLKGQGKTIQELAASKRLFMLDYEPLRCLKIKPPMYFYAPHCLIYKELLDGGKSRLNILGFQLEPNGPIYTPSMPQRNRYKLAKMFLGVADTQIHEFIHHLGFSHLGIEPIIIATHNALSEDNFIRVMLEPHFKETIGINFMARQTLVANEYAFTDQTFAVGTSQALDIVSNAWQKYDFFKNSFPEDLKTRGFDREKTDGLEDYCYRDDGFLVWDALGAYTTDVVNHFYPSGDKGVVGCSHVQGWAKEMVNKAQIPGFPNTITTREQLAHVLQIIIWNASALHSVVNFPQWNYYGFIPNRPITLLGPMPADDGKDITDADLQKILPDMLRCDFQILFAWLLSLPSDENLSDMHALDKLYPEADQRIRKRFEEITAIIQKRNAKLETDKQPPYPFLLPGRVASSVNI